MRYFLAREASEKNLSWRSSEGVLVSFLSSVIYGTERMDGYGNESKKFDCK